MTGSDAPSLEFRRASALVVTLRKDVYEVTNFLQQISFLCNSLCLEILSDASDWKPAQKYFTNLSEYPAASVAPYCRCGPRPRLFRPDASSTSPRSRRVPCRPRDAASPSWS